MFFFLILIIKPKNLLKIGRMDFKVPMSLFILFYYFRFSINNKLFEASTIVGSLNFKSCFSAKKSDSIK